MKTIIIDNFLPYPGVVRSWALQQEYYNSEQITEKYGNYTSWPGKRTDHVMCLDADYANNILSRVIDLVRVNFIKPVSSVKSYFQICTSADGDSWVHQDNNVIAAAVLYLSPNADINSGTILYRCKDLEKWTNLHISDMMKINREERKDLYDSLFEETDFIGNVYNRLVLYSGLAFHKSNKYFGNDRFDGRLTQTFFISE